MNQPIPLPRLMVGFYLHLKLLLTMMELGSYLSSEGYHPCFCL
uniref:Uncharacterized protein n=1 Tax=Picea glauca TaxID=3330 RepID=A0A101LZG7_PICGL|nr:hypothetical protein ABT39_MTgene5221 [Picea glauca]